MKTTQNHSSAALSHAPRWWQAQWLHPLNDTTAINDLLASVNPLWSLTEVRAEVCARQVLTADTVSLHLRPNRLWCGFVAGQHVPVTVEINGVRHTRLYSISSDAARAQSFSITVKRQPNGRVSNHLHDQVRVGTVLTLGQAQGDFTLPAQAVPLLLLSAGSGITPMRALLHSLEQRHATGDGAHPVTLLHVCRDADDFIFADDLRQLAARAPWFTLQLWHTRAQGRPSAQTLLAQVPDHPTRALYLCGPATLMDAVEQHWGARAEALPLRSERFAPTPLRVASGVACEVQRSHSEQLFTANAGESLLDAAERAGLSPAYGCRMGICRSCLCHKRSGEVENAVTGEISHGDEWIRLCVSHARTPIQLDL